MIQPNPDVYRRAAFLVLKHRYDKRSHPSGLVVSYSCEAVKVACMELGETLASRIMHVAQYQNMFGPNPVEHLEPFKTLDGTPTAIHPDPDIGGWEHPYWTSNDTDEVQDMRALALLFMAELVANP